MDVSSSADVAWFSLNPVSGTSTSTPTNICAHARVHTHTHTYLQCLFACKLTLNCSIQGTKILLSHSKKWQVAISHHVVLPSVGKEGGQSEEAERKQVWKWGHYVLTLPSPHHSSPLLGSMLHLSRQMNLYTARLLALPWNHQHSQLTEEVVVSYQRASPDQEKMLKSQQFPQSGPAGWTPPLTHLELPSELRSSIHLSQCL